jgi:hypothetical protein
MNPFIQGFKKVVIPRFFKSGLDVVFICYYIFGRHNMLANQMINNLMRCTVCFLWSLEVQIEANSNFYLYLAATAKTTLIKGRVRRIEA